MLFSKQNLGGILVIYPAWQMLSSSWLRNLSWFFFCSPLKLFCNSWKLSSFCFWKKHKLIFIHCFGKWQRKCHKSSMVWCKMWETSEKGCCEMVWNRMQAHTVVLQLRWCNENYIISLTCVCDSQAYHKHPLEITHSSSSLLCPCLFSALQQVSQNKRKEQSIRA